MRLLLHEVDVLTGALSLAHRHCSVDRSGLSLLFVGGGGVGFAAPQLLLILRLGDVVAFGGDARLRRIIGQSPFLYEFAD